MSIVPAELTFGQLVSNLWPRRRGGLAKPDGGRGWRGQEALRMAPRPVFALKGQPQTSPGQSGTTPVVPRRPGWRTHHAPQALKGRNRERPEIVPPFQGLSRGWAFYPGRRSTTFVVSLCPGLICGCPFGAKSPFDDDHRIISLIQAVNGWDSPGLRFILSLKLRLGQRGTAHESTSDCDFGEIADNPDAYTTPRENRGGSVLIGPPF